MEHNEALENGTELDELVRILHIAEANRDTCRALLNALESDVVRLSRVLISATANSKPAEEFLSPTFSALKEDPTAMLLAKMGGFQK
jgi:hypothetical protein